ncbi:hypothetical protein [Thalassotalea sp. ND16A]|uniref:hypothetical protein n=1 Tax=Thalassotalea sp. ND16A TaxID=1535422 RepID=UPI00051DCFBC|nr:hypothetical protein [Thalassotalea sp. ND16A]KGJ97718.1 hypothetical protein ND16A_0997 [Thalassotalea sp. ND16A]
MADLLTDALAQSSQFSELCSALYEREINLLADAKFNSAEQVQARLKSLPHYIKRTAGSMLAVDSPLLLDLQNGSWSEKQAKKIPLKEQSASDIQKWYQNNKLQLGLVVPVLIKERGTSRIMIDCIDRIDLDNQRFRSNYCGWFYLTELPMHKDASFTLLKPSKKVLTAACSGHQWQGNNRTQPSTLSLRELLLSCQINWRNFKLPASIKSQLFNSQ